ncbi:MAG TPA: hypothetical protein VGZ73_12030 [Bryobacteraceae bacterium]|jgi:hypothetical protein|nr:hypothetical protein [Bryobacteraceae bacterium]
MQPRPTEAELAILGVFWKHAPSTVGQVQQALKEVRNKLAEIRKLIDSLEGGQVMDLVNWLTQSPLIESLGDALLARGWRSRRVTWPSGPLARYP